MVKQTFSIPDMHCVNCVMRLESLEDDLVGIQTIKGSYHKQTLEVVYDDTLLSEQALRQAITELGYTIQS
jgi:copper chaperone